MSKIGFNVLTFHPDKSRRHILDVAAGLWLPDLGEPNPLILGRYMDVGCKWLRNTSGKWVTEGTFDENVAHKFKIDNFLHCCTILGATPIVGVSVHQPLKEAWYILNYIRNTIKYEGDVIVEFGNEPYLGKQKVEGEWPRDYTPEQYCDALHEFRAIADEFECKVAAVTVDGVRHNLYPKWTEKVTAGAREVIDYGSLHCYYSDPQETVQSINDMHELTQGLDFLITEWNYPQNALGGMSKQLWTTFMLIVLDDHPHVLSHFIWDSSCGEAWKLFETDGTPTDTWKGYEWFKQRNS